MASKTFNTGTVIDAPWLNDVNAATYTGLPNALAQISANTANISTNTTNIVANTTLITTHTGQITTAQSDLSALQLTDYVALRGYTGGRNSVYVISPAQAGMFVRDSSDTTSTDNGDTVIVASNGVRWKRSFGAYIGGVTQGRSRINYYSDTSVQVYMPNKLVMGGFRVNGSYKNGQSPLIPTGVDGNTVVNIPSQLGAETAVKSDNWYAVFACANPGDATTTFKLVPFLRVGSVAGSVATLNYAGTGANAHSIVAATYTFSTNGLANTDCLVVTELSGGNNRFAGRTTKITANTTTTVTLQTAGTIGAYDYLLPAPPGFQYYVYLGAFYMDSSSHVLNIADSGQTVYSTSTYIQDPNFVATGAIASPGVQMHCGGYVSPLATAIVIQDNESLSTASTGSLYANFAHDSSAHLIGQTAIIKEASTSPYSNVAYVTLPFSISQSFYYYTAGSLASSRSGGQLVVAGYIEP